MANYVKKIALAGDWGTGKTSLVRRFVYNLFEDKYIQTIGAKVSKKTVKLGSKEGTHIVNLIIWDVLGQKDYRMIHANAFRGLDGAIFVCDLTRMETLQGIHDYWYPQIVKVSGKVPFMIFGNKSDLKEQHKFGLSEIIGVGATIGIPADFCILTSAKTGENVEKSFLRIARACLSTPERQVYDEEKHTGIYMAPEVYTARAVLDAIIMDFIEVYGKEIEGMEIVEKCAGDAGINMSVPDKVALRKFVDLIKNVELEKGISQRDVEENYARRLMMIAYIE